MNQSSYKVDGFDILDFEGDVPKRWYIRAILDISSCEFERSELTNEKRIDIVTTLGVDRMESVLDECFKETHPRYSAADQVALCAKFIGLDSQQKLTENELFKLKTESHIRKALSNYSEFRKTGEDKH